MIFLWTQDLITVHLLQVIDQSLDYSFISITHRTPIIDLLMH